LQLIGAAFYSNIAIDDGHVYNLLMVGSKEIAIETKIQLYLNLNNFNLNVSNELVGKQCQVLEVRGG
jgi:hypothetical protein